MFRMFVPKPNFPFYIDGIVPEGRINKITHLQETKFIRLFCFTYVHMPKCNCPYLCIEQHQHYALLQWHISPYFMLSYQLFPIMRACWYALLTCCPRHKLQTSSCNNLQMPDKRIVALGGLVVSVLATGPKVRGFKSAARLPSERK
jgi:hypothetical protein